MDRQLRAKKQVGYRERESDTHKGGSVKRVLETNR